MNAERGMRIAELEIRHRESFRIFHSPFRIGARSAMKVRASVKPICEKCKIIKRKGILRIVCENPKHKQRQG